MKLYIIQILKTAGILKLKGIIIQRNEFIRQKIIIKMKKQKERDDINNIDKNIIEKHQSFSNSIKKSE